MKQQYQWMTESGHVWMWQIILQGIYGFSSKVLIRFAATYSFPEPCSVCYSFIDIVDTFRYIMHWYKHIKNKHQPYLQCWISFKRKENTQEPLQSIPSWMHLNLWEEVLVRGHTCQWRRKPFTMIPVPALSVLHRCCGRSSCLSCNTESFCNAGI